MLNNTKYRLAKDKRLTIGYFGGSITEGAGASKPANCWRSLITEWFRSKYPEAEITPIQAAIGGTGSKLGIFRMERDLLSKKPDLVFIEFSVNDGMGNYDEIMADSETIVRKIYAANPYAEIVYVHTTTKSISDRIAAGEEYIARSAHSAVMHRYGIAQIDVGEILRNKVMESGGDWKQFTVDTVHPNDAGYRIYTDAIARLLEGLLGGEGSLEPVKLPAKISCLSDRTAARLVDGFDVKSDWTRVEKSMCGRYDHYIEALEPGKELEFRFRGSRVGIYCMFAKDSGDLICSLDGEEKSISTWDTYCKQFNRAGSIILGGELEYGDHVLKLRVSDMHNEESEGNAVRIGAFMVY